MEFNPYSLSNLESKTLFCYCLSIGDVKRINRYVPITEVVVTMNKTSNYPFLKISNNIDYDNRFGICKLFTTKESAEIQFEEDKLKEIAILEERIDSIKKLQNKIKKL